MRYKTCILISASFLSLVACEQSPKPATPAATPVKLAEDIAAGYTTGSIQIEQIESEFASARTPACMTVKSSPGGGSVDTLIPCYREVAEAIAIEDIVLADIPDRALALSELDDNFVEQRNTVLLTSWSRQLAEQVEVTELEIEQFFNEHSDELKTPRRFSLYNIFRRHRNPDNPDETIEFLLGLKSRIEAGETFASIARAHSDSETRLRDGAVGSLTEQQLPQRLREYTATLENGELSEPIKVNGGAILIKIEGATPAIEPDLERHRNGISNRLTEEKTQAAIDTRLADQQFPADALIYAGEELLNRLDSEDAYQLVFDLGGQQLTIAEFREMVGLKAGDIAADLPDDNREMLLEFYAQLQRRRLLLISLLASDDAEIMKLREQAGQPLEKERLTYLVDKQLQTDMWRSVDQKTAGLERFFKDNSHHYQSPLKFKLQVWHLPFDDNPSRQLASMELLRIEIEQGEQTLASAALGLGGSVEDLGWREFTELSDLPQKARNYLLQAKTGGYSIPYQQDETIHMIWLENRLEPEALEYDAVKERVREDYYTRFERKLYLEAVEQRLAAANFVFSDDNVKRWLLPKP